jgi:hypothetical protein
MKSRTKSRGVPPQINHAQITEVTLSVLSRSAGNHASNHANHAQGKSRAGGLHSNPRVFPPHGFKINKRKETRHPMTTLTELTAAERALVLQMFPDHDEPEIQLRNGHRRSCPCVECIQLRMDS